MKPYVKWLVLLIAGGFFFGTPAFAQKVTEVDWRTLYGLNYRTGEMTSKLSKLKGKDVRIPGFMVPLEGTQTEIREFLFVPDRGACIHVPPPPPNLTIYVKMPQNRAVQFDWGPVWLEGSLWISDRTTVVPFIDGQLAVKSSYTLEGKLVEPYVIK